MPDIVSFKSSPHGLQWHVTKDDVLVTVYSIRFIAERAATRLALATARQGRSARTLFYQEDGTIGTESMYRLPSFSHN